MIWSVWRAGADERVWKVHRLLSGNICSESEIRTADLYIMSSAAAAAPVHPEFNRLKKKTPRPAPYTLTTPTEQGGINDKGPRSQGSLCPQKGMGALKMTSADKWKTQTLLISIWLVKDGRSGRFIRSIQRDSDIGGVKDGAQGLKRRVRKTCHNRDAEGLWGTFRFFLTQFLFSFFLQLFNHLIKVILWLSVLEDAGQTYGRAG